MKQELTNLANKVKIRISDVENELQRHNGQLSDSARKRESENKKLVKLVSLLTNKLLR